MTVTPLTSVGDRLRYALITGFGTGLAPVAPGTFGTLPGVAIAYALCASLTPNTATLTLWLLATALLAFGCAQTTFTARAFARKDPGAFVLDEIVGYLFTVALFATILGPNTDPLTHLTFFLTFRFFDVLKPPPARQLERLPGAPGIMLDDVAAGLLAGAVSCTFYSV